jgi:hypothetical protein
VAVSCGIPIDVARFIIASAVGRDERTYIAEGGTPIPRRSEKLQAKSIAASRLF